MNETSTSTAAANDTSSAKGSSVDTTSAPSLDHTPPADHTPPPKRDPTGLIAPWRPNDESVATFTEISDSQDPFQLLLNASSDSRIWFLLGAPAGLLLIVALIYAVIVTIRNRRENRAMAQHVADAEAGRSLPDDEEEDEGADDAYELPRELADGASQSASARHLRLIKSDAELALQKAKASPKAAAASEIDEVRTTDRSAWRLRLTAGLSKARDSLRQSLSSAFLGKTKIDAAVLDKLHEALYRADIGVATADRLVDAVRTQLGKAEAADWNQVSRCLKDAAREILNQQQAAPLVRPDEGPWVVLVVGVNGVGKTTTIGKLGAHELAEDRKVLLAAADTFRAAAIDQLKIWGDRLGVDVVAHQPGSDPAAVAYDAVKAALARQMDTVLIDTAGRLHSKAELMDELGKINRVIGRDLPKAPHETWLVLDATTGQNAVAQVKAFREVVALTGLIITKLDGTAKGGVVIGIADQFKLPIRYIGVGEKAADLRAFDPTDFVESLF